MTLFQTFPKPRSRKAEGAARRRAKSTHRAACVAHVWARAGGHCEGCGRAVVPPTLAGPAPHAGHVHEIQPRAHGGDPLDPTNCLLLCRVCHDRTHATAPTAPHRRLPAPRT